MPNQRTGAVGDHDESWTDQHVVILVALSNLVCRVDPVCEVERSEAETGQRKIEKKGLVRHWVVNESVHVKLTAGDAPSALRLSQTSMRVGDVRPRICDSNG